MPDYHPRPPCIIVSIAIVVRSPNHAEDGWYSACSGAAPWAFAEADTCRPTNGSTL